MMTGSRTKPFLLFMAAFTAFASATMAADNGAWRIYSEEANGDVYFFDTSRVTTTSDLRTVWQRIRYKTSVMAASSYQSHLEIDCAARTERVLQRTFFSDRRWEKPAMATDMKKKSKKRIKKGSATERLAGLLCDQ